MKKRQLKKFKNNQSPKYEEKHLSTRFFILRKRYHIINRIYKKLTGINKATKDFVDILYKFDNEGNFDRIIRNHLNIVPEKIKSLIANAEMHIQVGVPFDEVLNNLLFNLDEKIFKPYSMYAIDKWNGKTSSLDSLTIDINGVIFKSLNCNLPFEELLEIISKSEIVLKDQYRNIQKSLFKNGKLEI